jgi:putative hydrolase of the HAD superfamily
MQMIDWQRIDTVFLDMDGTLLDLNFDTYFWLEHVPQRYSEKHGVALEVAKAQLMERYQALLGTIDWYSIDYWTRELELDIALLKEEVDHLIAVHPYVTDFLDAVRAAKKRVVLVTNAHMKSLELKMDRTRLGGHFDRLVCSHDLGLPKEAPEFWERLQEVERFEPQRTLLVDDSLPVLRSARAYGIGWLLAVYEPDTRQPRRDVAEFDAIETFRDILP